MNHSHHRAGGRALEVFRKNITTSLSTETGAHWLRSETDVNVELIHLPPGGASWPHALRREKWGLYWIEQGFAQVRSALGMVEMRAGDYIVQPPGRRCQILNESQSSLWILAISRKSEKRTPAVGRPRVG